MHISNSFFVRVLNLKFGASKPVKKFPSPEVREPQRKLQYFSIKEIRKNEMQRN